MFSPSASYSQYTRAWKQHLPTERRESTTWIQKLVNTFPLAVHVLRTVASPRGVFKRFLAKLDYKATSMRLRETTGRPRKCHTSPHLCEAPRAVGSLTPTGAPSALRRFHRRPSVLWTWFATRIFVIARCPFRMVSRVEYRLTLRDERAGRYTKRSLVKSVVAHAAGAIPSWRLNYNYKITFHCSLPPGRLSLDTTAS